MRMFSQIISLLQLLLQAISFASPLVLVSCSSTGSGGRGGSQGNLQELPKSLENSDFVPKPQVPYRASEDEFSLEGLEVSDVLARETISRLDDSDVKKFEDETDPLSTISSLCYQRKFEKAYDLVDSAYAEYKRHPTYWNQLGTCYYLEGNFAKARLYYNKSMEVNKNYSPPMNNLGVLYLKEGRDQKAALAFKMAKEKNAFSLVPLFNLAQLYLKYGFLQKALDSFKVLYGKNSSDPDVTVGLATCYLFSGRPQEAYRLFSGLPLSYFKRPETGINYAVTLKLLKKDEEAASVLDEVDTSKLKSWEGHYQKVKKFLEGKQ